MNYLTSQPGRLGHRPNASRRGTGLAFSRRKTATARFDGSWTVAYQVFDAFCNKVGGGTLMACDGGSPRLASGRAQWRGGEGTLTDHNGDDIYAGPPAEYGSWPENHEQYTRPSSGLVFMQARMYDPATGRFTQADPLAYGFEALATGQNNRWVYAGNDPVNMSDPSGLIHPQGQRA